ncbi:MAG: type II toxin-antitoxin system VapC family toxin [Deltaproteobacteria bacterium]|nr:type II toxin-antitoxin system VapC family toxin [Deltaproteobacteria bacterium]
MKYLLDTNVLSESVKTSPKKSVLAKLERHQHEITTASVVWHELLYGCYRLPKSKKRSIIERFLEEVVYPNVPILPYDEYAAKWHANIRARLISKGQTLPFADGQIAAIAKVNDLILVTNNTADFAYFDELRLENWYE